MKRQSLMLLTAIWALVACTHQETEKAIPTEGWWRATLDIGDYDLPFQIHISHQQGEALLSIVNGKDTITVSEASMYGDTLLVQLPIYHATISAIVTDSTMEGSFHNYYRSDDYQIPFSATYGQQYRFRPPMGESPAVAGVYSVLFSPGTDKESEAVGLLEVQGIEVTGTVLSPYGDYRYLAGMATGDSLFLSNFDGMHVMLFVASLGDTISGMYYSGNHYSEPFIAWRNEEAALPDAFTLASAPADQPFVVMLPGEDGALVNWMANGQPAIIEIMGTWCPNCKDEARLLDTIHQSYAEQGLQVISLSFERARDSVQAVRNIQRMQDYMQLSYPVIYAGYANSEGVAAVLPLLQGFTAYPTAIFVHGDGRVEAVHTGFSGPATGRAYTQTAEQYYALVGRLLQQ